VWDKVELARKTFIDITGKLFTFTPISEMGVSHSPLFDPCFTGDVSWEERIQLSEDTKHKTDKASVPQQVKLALKTLLGGENENQFTPFFTMGSAPEDLWEAMKKFTLFCR